VEYIPYVYMIKNKTTGLKYIGVRYARGCHPSDLWHTYFTSSSVVKKLIAQFGLSDWYVRILHRFPADPAAAILREASYFPLIKKRHDYLNMTYSSGFQDLRINSKAGKVGGAIVKAKRIGIFRNIDERSHWCSLGGSAGSKSQIENGIGIHTRDRQLRQSWASMGGKKGAFTQSKWQSEFGKRSGSKNKGNIFINDGERTIGYTARDQEKMSIDDFLKLNPKYKKGKYSAKNKEN